MSWRSKRHRPRTDRRRCRPVEIDGEVIRVQGDGDMSDEAAGALAEVIRAVRDQMDDGDYQAAADSNTDPNGEPPSV